MAMSTCRECGEDVSTEAQTCPRCGVPRPTLVRPADGGLDSAVADLVRRGFQIENSSENSITLFKVSRPNHVAHAILSLLTLGFWLIIWLLIALFAGGSIVRVELSVDPSGRVLRRTI